MWWNRRNLVFSTVTLVSLVLDQATKAWVVANVDLYRGEIQIIPGFFSIVHAQNPGAAFSMLADMENRHVLFMAMTVVALFIVGDLFRQLEREDVFMSATLGLLLSGALGNAIDRARQQYVTDFLRFYTDDPGWTAWLAQYGLGNEYPSFNVADSALVVGVLMFLLTYTFKKDAGPVNEPAASAPT